MTRENHELNRVFGVARSFVPETYVSRTVDKELETALYSQNHIVIRGDTKQGKTCLRRHHLPDDVCIIVTCQREWSYGDLNKNILRKAGVKIIEVATDEITGAKISPKVSGNIGVVKVEFGGDVNAGQSVKRIEKDFEVNFEDMGDVIEFLKRNSEKKFIVIDDFHCLEQRVQFSFASAVKHAFEDSDYTFVIIGVWRDDNKLVRLNGDLQGRVSDVPVLHWKVEDLKEVINKGESLLNIKIDEGFKKRVADGSHGSVYIVQEACKRLCISKGIKSTSSYMTKIGSESEADEILDSISETMTARYGSFIADFLSLGGKAVDRVSHEDYLAIVNRIMMLPLGIIRDGTSFHDLISYKRSRFSPKKDFEKTLRSALQEIAHCQSALGYHPIILSYDNSEAKLEVVDSAFIFWLSRRDRRELLKQYGYH